MVADDLVYIVTRERGRGKVVAFAHNSHLQRGNTQMALGSAVFTWWPAGPQLNEMFGSRYAAIGSAMGGVWGHRDWPARSWHAGGVPDCRPGA
jgi:erythromycin esterase